MPGVGVVKLLPVPTLEVREQVDFYLSSWTVLT
jgi:hypothetical protein